MLISMPTGTSTIFGVFQVIRVSQLVWRDAHAEAEPRGSSKATQGWKNDERDIRFSLGQGHFSLGQSTSGHASLIEDIDALEGGSLPLFQQPQQRLPGTGI
jgi:hypothetical protein